uniref:DUF1553 domain-containing protein n=1 Tax=Solibacter usitatus (strain Ellin6076) TaxID=234267 RepID=Q01P56_SOLUE
MYAPRYWITGFASLLVFTGSLSAQSESSDHQLAVEHADCPYFGPQRERFVDESVRLSLGMKSSHQLSSMTAAVGKMLGYVPGGSRTYNYDQSHAAGSIDSYIFADLQAKNITPAPKTTDWEFIRRVTLDLTGRIPNPDRVLSFVADTAPDKRAKLIDELLARPEWVDKWTMFYGDLFKNTTNKASTGLNRFAQGRNAFYQWIKQSLADGKPYNQMATELLSIQSDSTYTDGAADFLVGSIVTGGPTQDIMDQMTADTFDTFLGVTHVNCLLCHNGRGHLDALSLWATSTTRYQAWQLAGFLSHTGTTRIVPDPANNPNVFYYSLQDNIKNFTLDYTLNTTTGNRPARVSATPNCKSGQPCYYVPPQYIFNGNAPKPGENYRAALARNITGDFQFARAAVNYMWAYFFGRGIVDPPDTFDPARLDPDNPPPAPWTLQPSNPRLLNSLAQHFIDSGFNVKSLMREIATSDTYQLSSRYNGQWSAEYEPYFARKFVRRLWGEEIHDAVVQSSGSYPSYSVRGWTDLGMPKVTYAMQFPDVINVEGTTDAFLDSFLRGNRDDQPRKSEGSILQALNLMNSSIIENRLAITGASASQLMVQVLAMNNTDAVNRLYLTILSRYPSDDEKSKALASLPAATSARNLAMQDLAWSLYNKVDFVFNY